MRKKTDKSSTKLGGLIDEYGELDKLIRKKDAETAKLRSARHKMGQHLLALFSKKKLKGASGMHFKSSVVRDKHPKIKNHKQFIKYVVANKAYDLFQNRISKKAYMDRLKEGQKIEGTEIFESTRLNIRSMK